MKCVLHPQYETTPFCPDCRTNKERSLAARDTQVGGDHYKRMSVQPWDVIDTWPREQRIGFYRGNALKYVMRLGTKDEEVGEAGKARHYLDKLIEVLKEPQS